MTAPIPAGALRRVEVERGEWLDTLTRAHHDGFEVFDWLAAVDDSDREPGVLAVLVHVIALTPGPGPRLPRRLLVRTRVRDGEALASLTCLYAGAAWHEREAHEMFGLGVDGFDDGSGLGMRRLLLSESAPQTPLRHSVYLEPRLQTPWPGAADPGPTSAGRRGRNAAPGVPDPAAGAPDSASSSRGGRP